MPAVCAAVSAPPVIAGNAVSTPNIGEGGRTDFGAVTTIVSSAGAGSDGRGSGSTLFGRNSVAIGETTPANAPP